MKELIKFYITSHCTSQFNCKLTLNLPILLTFWMSGLRTTCMSWCFWYKLF